MARRISFTICSGVARVSDFCLICASPKSYDEPEILPSSSHPVCPRCPAAGHSSSTTIISGTTRASVTSPRPTSTSGVVRPSCSNEKGLNATPSKPDDCNTAARPHNIKPRCARFSLRSRTQRSQIIRRRTALAGAVARGPCQMTTNAATSSPKRRSSGGCR